MNADDRMREVARVRLDSWLNEQTAKHIQKMQTIKETQIQFIKKMLEKNFSLNDIADVSGMPVSDIRDLQAGLSI
jgi:hypothetical protein